MDGYDYPTDEQLDFIREWKGTDHLKLMEYVKTLWWAADWGWRESNMGNVRVFNISTGGWSGNESLIDALEENVIFWAFCWWRSDRGGHYRFEILPITEEQEDAH